jgi:cytochrome c556
MSRSIIGLLVAIAVSIPADTRARGPISPTPAWPDFPAPGYLPPTARELLRTRMGRHVEQANQLLVAVLTLDHDAVAANAAEIAAEPKLSRFSGDLNDTVNQRLPERFFALQDELQIRATEVNRSAATGDNQAVARAFGKLTETCVNCHSAYLYGR